MRIDLVTIFPELFDALNYGVLARAIKDKIIEVHHWNPRKHANNEHGYIDDKPYGGGPGMVMCYEPLYKTVEEIKNQSNIKNVKVVCMSPQGTTFTHKIAQAHTELEQLILICGRYEGIDQRFIDHCVDEVWSIGDFILSGGEFAACCIIDTITRLLPGTLGNPDSLISETFTNDQHDYPVYTRPAEIHGHAVPEVLLKGNHADIEKWRNEQRNRKDD